MSTTSESRSTTSTHPPNFDEARNPRQKARAAGLHPDYWYAVEYDGALKRGAIIEINFWKSSIALYRGDDHKLRAVENRCAHRQLKLSHGEVNDCNLVCAYHGWTYDTAGNVVDLMAALRASVEAAKRSRGESATAPAKTEPAKTTEAHICNRYYLWCSILH